MKSYKINKGLITQKLEGKTVIFDGEESVLYTLNETASFMFGKIKLGWDRKKIVSALLKKYNIKPKKARSDLEEFFSNLSAKKVITWQKE